MITRTFLILALAISVLAMASAPPPSGEILIVYTGNTLGELKPCGCSGEDEQGGFERRMTYVQQTRSGNPNMLLVSTGDNFKEPTTQGKIKARYLLDSLAQMDYDAVALGDHDLVYGNEFIRKREDIPWLGSNIESEGLILPKVRIKRFTNGLKAALIAVADPTLFGATRHSGARVSDPAETVKQRIDAVKKSENPDLVILLSHMPRDKALNLTDMDGVDVVINGHIETEDDIIDMTPVSRGGKIFIQPGPRGQKMGELRVRIEPGKEPSYEQRMVRLDSSIKFAPEMVELYEAYNGEIEDLFFASRAAQKKRTQQKVYATEQTCMTCHAQAHEVWSQSRHGHAYATLRKINKAFDPECLQCHVTGFDVPGGFISEVDTPELENVQCEVCHGAGREHAASPGPGFGLEAREACKRCHVKNHSPKFNFAEYWPKIKHSR